MIAAIYARKSTEQTGVADEQKSVARRIDHARQYVTRKGWTVDEESKGRSGTGARLLKRISTVFLVFVAIGLVAPATMHGQCVILDKPEELFAASSAVFIGTVVAHELTGTQGFHVTVDVATFRPERSWKGDVSGEISVAADMPFEVGKRYLVFAGGDPLGTSIPCRWTERIDGTTTKTVKMKLDWLSKKPSRKIDAPKGKP